MHSVALDLPAAAQPDAQATQAVPPSPNTLPTTSPTTSRATFQLDGLYCAACAGVIESALRAVPGVAEVVVSAAARQAHITWHRQATRTGDFIDAVQAAGYRAWTAGHGDAALARRAEQRRLLWRLFVAAFCMMQVMMFAAPGWLYGVEDIEPDLRQLLNWGAWAMSLPLLLFSATPFFAGAWQAARRGRIGMDVPVALAVAITFVAGTAATFDPGSALGTEVYFDSLAMFITFLLAGRWLELRVRHRAQAAHERALADLPRTAQRVHAHGEVEEVAIEAVQTGDVLRVARGERFAADGVIIAGQTRADEALLTGESQAVPKACGTTVRGGSLNLAQPVEIRVLRTGDASCQGQIEALMREAATTRPESVHLADRYAGAFIAVVLLLAATGFAAWQFIDPSRALWVAVAVLVVTCPCALSLATPAALLAATQGLQRRGVVVRRLAVIEGLADVTHVLWDKTGTLTLSQPAVTHAQVLTLTSAAQRAGMLAAWSQHPKAQAIVRWARAVLASESNWRDAQEMPGAGVQAIDEQGSLWRLGRSDWASSSATPHPPGAVVLSRDGIEQMVFEFGESLRPDARQALNALQQSGLALEVLSGDADARVHAITHALQLPAAVTAHAQMLPADKLARVTQLQAQGAVVAMVGDGLNDGPVLAAADVSFAMAQGSALAQGQADALIASGKLMSLVQARELALRCRCVMRSNLRWALAYNLACVPLALAGTLPPWAAGLGMAASSAWVVWRSHRLAN
jgi:P-type Cu2+ transporter